MALTRNFLKALGLNEEQINSIVEAHTETISGIKDELKTAKAKAEKLGEVEKELNDLKTANAGAEDFKTKYEREHKDFENYKSEIVARETKATKEKAVKAYFESKGITGKNLAIAMRGVRPDIDGIELDGDKIKDKTALDDLIKGDYAGLVATTKVEGVTTANPPTNTGGGVKTKQEIVSIKDPEERQAAWAEYLGIGDNNG